MAFDFLGTYTQSQLDKLKEFAVGPDGVSGQLADVAARILHLEAEITRIGVVTVTRENNDPAGKVTNIEVSPPNSRLGKLASAYRVLGGNLLDLNLIGNIGDGTSTAGEQPLTPLKGRIEYGAEPGQGDPLTEVDNPIGKWSNKEPQRRILLGDAIPSVTTEKIKDWMLGAIRYKREDLEYKIKNALDLSEMMQKEIILLLRRTEIPEDDTKDFDDTVTKHLADAQGYIDDSHFPSATPDSPGGNNA